MEINQNFSSKNVFVRFKILDPFNQKRLNINSVSTVQNVSALEKNIIIDTCENKCESEKKTVKTDEKKIEEEKNIQPAIENRNINLDETRTLLSEIKYELELKEVITFDELIYKMDMNYVFDRFHNIKTVDCSYYDSIGAATFRLKYDFKLMEGNNDPIRMKIKDFPHISLIKDLKISPLIQLYLIKRKNNDHKFELDSFLPSNYNKGLYMLKCIKRHDLDNKNDYEKNIFNEVKMGKLLFHPNLLLFFGSFKSENMICNVYEHNCCGEFYAFITSRELQIDLNFIRYYSAQLLFVFDYLICSGNKINLSDINIRNDFYINYNGYLKLNIHDKINHKGDIEPNDIKKELKFYNEFLILLIDHKTNPRMNLTEINKLLNHLQNQNTKNYLIKEALDHEFYKNIDLKMLFFQKIDLEKVLNFNLMKYYFNRFLDCI